ncbi:hypothetical protein WJX81_005067 [Elliptochloris bilobata]|uniref:Uncharacterized protein n=1 Tax=Elliptochloris bilobata TaxID=381761 RepID=A0AAW1SIN9_9CHLO
MEDVSVEDLLKELQSAQETKSSARLSERNVVELISKLQELGFLGSDLLHSINGREYLTLEHLRSEVLQAVEQAGGRIAVVDLPALLGVDLVHCERQAAAAVSGSGASLQAVQGELITQGYFDNLAAEINELLQEAGVVAMGELARRYALGAELMQAAVGPRVGHAIRGRLEGGLLYTAAYLSRIKAQLRGALRGAAAPVMLAPLVKELDSGMGGGGGGSGRGAVATFYAQNGFVEYEAVRRAGIPGARAHLAAAFPGGIALDSAFVAPELAAQVEAGVEEALDSAGWADAAALAPAALSPADAAALLERCPAVRRLSGKGDAGGGAVLAGTWAVTAACLAALQGKVAQWLPEVEGAGEAGALASVLAALLRPGALRVYDEALAAVFSAGADARRRRREAAAAALQAAWERLQLLAAGVAPAAAGDAAASTALARHLVRGEGEEAVNALLRYQAAMRDDEDAPEGQGTAGRATEPLGPLSAGERAAILGGLPQDERAPAAAAVGALGGADAEALIEALAEAAGAAGLRLRRLERRAERAAVAARRAALAEALEREGDPAAALALAVPLLVARVHGHLAAVPGRALGAVIAGLAGGMPPAAHAALAAFHADVVSALRAASGGGGASHRALREQVVLSQAQVHALGRDLAASSDAQDVASKAMALWRQAESSTAARAVARAMICLFFANEVLDAYQKWQHMNTPEMKLRRATYPHRTIHIPFPYLGVCVVLPAAAAAAAGVRVPAAASVLSTEMLWSSGASIWAQLAGLWRHRQRPDELAIKRLAMLGAVVLVLVHSLRRIALRDWALASAHKPAEAWLRDAHDNNLLLLQAVLAVPFAFGYRTAAVARLLALLLLLEAVVCWPAWTTYPTWHYQAHVRSHFCTNLGVAGGLVLLQSVGAGSFTVDRLLQKKAT